MGGSRNKTKLVKGIALFEQSDGSMGGGIIICLSTCIYVGIFPY